MQRLPSDPAQKRHVPHNPVLIYLVENPHLYPETNKQTNNNAMTTTQAIRPYSRQKCNR
jgi:hypothetical protein